MRAAPGFNVKCLQTDAYGQWMHTTPFIKSATYGEHVHCKIWFGTKLITVNSAGGERKRGRSLVQW